MNLTPEQLAKVTPDHPIFAVMERLEKIQSGMLRADPELPTHLKVVHKALLEYEELAHLLTPENIGVLMKGLQQHTSISLATEVKPKSSKKGPKVTVDDLL